jgi:hypothetical protein
MVDKCVFLVQIFLSFEKKTPNFRYEKKRKKKKNSGCDNEDMV